MMLPDGALAVVKRRNEARNRNIHRSPANNSVAALSTPHTGQV